MTRYCNGNTFAALLLLLLFSCRSSKRVAGFSSINGLPPLQESVINIPFKVYLKPLLAKAEATIPLQLISSGWPDFFSAGCDFRYKYRFIRSGLRFSCVNNKAVVTMLGNYQLAGGKTICAFGRQVSPWISGSCGFSRESMRRVTINIGSTFSFRSDYTMRSHSGVEQITAMDKCAITLLNTDITGMVTDNIRSSFNSFAASIDQTVAGINYAALINKIGTAIGKKIALGTYGYIKINPSAVHISAINYARDTLYFTAGFSCFPEVSSDSNNLTVPNSLPPLSTGLLNPGFVINTNAAYDYHFIDTLLTRSIKNKPFKIDGKNIFVHDITIRALDNNKVELKFNFTGSKSGTLFLTGTPALDTNKQVISIPDLDYSLKSTDLMLTLGTTFFNQRILSSIRKKTIIKIEDIYLNNKTRLDSAFNRNAAPNIFTTGNTQQVKLTGLVINKNNLLFQVSAKGVMSVTVK